MSSSEQRPSATATPQRHWYQRVGPGLITASVVIGPGSILTSSKIGAQHGYSMSWIVVAACVFMFVYMMLGAKLGVVGGHPAGDLVAHRAGRPLAALIGVGVFFISASFQFGNNLGVHSAFKTYIDFDYTIVLFNIMSISFLFLFKNLYRAIERLMMVFVALMLLSFALNLSFARPSLTDLAAGFIPPLGRLFNRDPAVESPWNLSLLGLVGTTFVVTAAYYQSYLVRQKGWRKQELHNGLVDSRVGAVIMALITLMIMSTSAAVLQGHELNDVGEVAAQLEPLFGRAGQALFCLGLFSAAYSSFLVNSMIGGFVLSDGLGLGSDPKDLCPRLSTTVVLLTGMSIALYAIKSGQKPVGAIVAAQAVTVVAAPLMAGALLWLTNRKDIMGDDRNGPVTNIVASIGFLLLLAMAWYMATAEVWPAVSHWLNST